MFEESRNPLEFTGYFALPAFKKVFQKYAIVSEGEESEGSGNGLPSSEILEELKRDDEEIGEEAVVYKKTKRGKIIKTKRASQTQTKANEEARGGMGVGAQRTPPLNPHSDGEGRGGGR